METHQNTPAHRVPLHLDISFKKIYSRAESDGTLKNISLSGAFLLHQGDTFRPNDKIHVKFKVADRERRISCRVVWVNGQGCGIKFIPTNNRDVQIVDDLIYFVETHRADKKEVLDTIFKNVS